jgi:hypothetical protein
MAVPFARFDPEEEVNRMNRLTSPCLIDDDLDAQAPEPHDQQESVMLLHHILLTGADRTIRSAFALYAMSALLLKLAASSANSLASYKKPAPLL